MLIHRLLPQLLAEILFVAACFSEPALSQTSPYEYFCPHEATRELDLLSRGLPDATEVWNRVRKARSSRDWGYARIDTTPVAGLRPDGTIDQKNPLFGNFILYPAGKGLVGDRSFWGRKYGTGPIFGQKFDEPREHVNAIQPIIDDLSRRDFALIEFSGAHFNVNDAVFTNTLFIDHQEPVSSLDFVTLKRLSEQVLSTMPRRGDQNFANSRRGIIAGVRLSSGRDAVVVFNTSRTNGYLVGDVIVLQPPEEESVGTVIFEADRELQRAKVLKYIQDTVVGDGRLYVYGELPHPDNLDLEKLAQDLTFDLVRRTPSTLTNLSRTDDRLDRLKTHTLKPATTSIVNAVPETLDQLQQMGFPAASLSGWQALRQSIERSLSGHFAKRITEKEEFIDELQNGSSDVLLLVAHSDGQTLYVAGNPISLHELAELRSRAGSRSKPRVAILVSCEAVRFAPSNKSLVSRVADVVFRRRATESLAALLVNKGFFDAVYAPDYEIDGKAALSALKDSISKLAISLNKSINGLSKVADLGLNLRTSADKG